MVRTSFLPRDSSAIIALRTQGAEALWTEEAEPGGLLSTGRGTRRLFQMGTRCWGGGERGREEGPKPGVCMFSPSLRWEPGKRARTGLGGGARDFSRGSHGKSSLLKMCRFAWDWPALNPTAAPVSTVRVTAAYHTDIVHAVTDRGN